MLSGLIVNRRGATAVSERPAAGGVALWPVFEVEESASPQKGGPLTGSKNMPRPPTWDRIVITPGSDGHAPAQMATSSPTTQTENICTLIVVAQSDDADRPLSAVDTPSPRPPRPLYRPARQHSGKRWIRVVETTTVYRSSAVSSAQALPTHAAPARHQRPGGPCPNIPQNPLGAPNPTPARPADLPFITASSRASSVSPVHGQSPALRGQRSCTAAQYSNPAAQHRPITPAIGRRPAGITTVDCPARSSGRRGRGFKSRHPDTLKCQVTGPLMGNQAWYFGVSGGRWENSGRRS
jgi:hypothetical protein